MISAGLYLAGLWRPVELYVDSGAAYTILRAKVANDVGFPYEKGRRILVQVGDGALIPVFRHDLPLQIGGRRFVVPIGFSAKLGVSFNLLGRAGVFEHYRILFREKRRVVSFQAEA
jgi:Aspartyl protease